MSDWIDVIGDKELDRGEHALADLDGSIVAVFRLEDGSIQAVEDICPHDGGDLASGLLKGDEITCTRHGARFCLRSGKVLSPPAYEDIATFPVRVEGGMIQVRDDRWD